ncbi:MAG: NADH-dependent oxidoreductase, partial [Verrucomicrobiota bacterium]
MKRWWIGLIFMAWQTAGAETIRVDAEQFKDFGGWKLDTQFIEIMGSPYLLAHGLGRPVADAKTTVHFPKTGTYRLWVRTKDWVAPWKAPGAPGRFQ